MKARLGIVIHLILVAVPSLALSDGPKCDGGKCERKVCFNVHCTYPKQEGQCLAAARFTKWVGWDGREIEDLSEISDGVQFEVQCDDETRFNGSARRFSDHQGTRIQATIGPFPAVILPPDALRDGHRYELSSLELGAERLRGFCYLYTGPEKSDELRK